MYLPSCYHFGFKFSNAESYICLLVTLFLNFLMLIHIFALNFLMLKIHKFLHHSSHLQYQESIHIKYHHYLYSYPNLTNSYMCLTVFIFSCSVIVHINLFAHRCWSVHCLLGHGILHCIIFIRIFFIFLH